MWGICIAADAGECLCVVARRPRVDWPLTLFKLTPAPAPTPTPPTTPGGGAGGARVHCPPPDTDPVEQTWKTKYFRQAPRVKTKQYLRPVATHWCIGVNQADNCCSAARSRKSGIYNHIQVTRVLATRGMITYAEHCKVPFVPDISKSRISGTNGVQYWTIKNAPWEPETGWISDSDHYNCSSWS